MRSVSNTKMCTGCRACVDVCPQKCIKMQEDKEHFVYPVIDDEKCIHCNLCEKKCPSNNSKFNEIKSVLVGLHKNKSIVHESASGGAFWALSQTLIPLGYAIAGVRWNNDFKAVYDIAETLDEAALFRKSKYVAADASGIYMKVKSLLKYKKVVFTGCPCEVSACRNICGDNDNLLLVDLVCHGAPNQVVFDRYKSEAEHAKNGKISSFYFRNKKPLHGVVNSRSACYSIGDKEYVVGINEDPFLRGYYSRLFYRPSCEHCKFAQPMRVGDITIADAWGVNDLYPDLDELAGVSMILLNTSKGQSLEGILRQNMELKDADKEWAIRSNAQLRKPTEFHSKRKVFFRNLDKLGFNGAVEKACCVGMPRRVAGVLFRFLKKMLTMK